MPRPVKHTVFLSIALLITSASALGEDPFPKASPVDTEASAEAVQLLSEFAESLVRREVVVGAELHVIKNRKTVLHQAYGWADRQEQRPLRVGSVFCVRSMTKPLTGTAIQMLVDEGKLTPDLRVSSILPEFNRPESHHITIEHLLTHTSGLPLSTINRPLTAYASIADVATDAAAVDLEFLPGTGFQYSDAGSDTLGAIIQSTTDTRPEEFITKRILKPLGMNDTVTLLKDDHPLRSRIPSAYSGGTGKWQRHWSDLDAPVFPLFLASQSLYCTTTDYARFLTLWMDGGVSNKNRLLSEQAVRRALAPGRRFSEAESEFENLQPTYAQQWVVYHGEDKSRPVMFGHSGSDGTHAWAWPEQDLMVLFFTQSRGTLAGVELEAVLDRLLIKGDLAAHRKAMEAQETAEETLRRYEGIYWDEDAASAYYTVTVEKNELVVERPGRFRSVAIAQPEEHTFEILAGAISLQFETDDDSTSAMLMTSRQRTERQPRHVSGANLPTVDEFAEKVRIAHGVNHIKSAAVVKLSGTITMGLLRSKGKVRHWYDQRRSRTEIDMGPTTMVVITNGNQAAVSPAGGPLEALQGIAREQEVIGHPAIQFGGWKRSYDEVQLLKQVDLDEGSRMLIRAKTQQSPNATIIVDPENGLVTGDRRIPFVPGVGFIGLETTYSDFRNVGNMKLPFHVISKFAHPLLGQVEIQYETAETDVSDYELFDLPEH